jgi:hypothetical protein
MIIMSIMVIAYLAYDVFYGEEKREQGKFIPYYQFRNGKCYSPQGNEVTYAWEYAYYNPKTGEFSPYEHPKKGQTIGGINGTTIVATYYAASGF